MKLTRRLFTLSCLLIVFFNFAFPIDESKVHESWLGNGLKVITYEIHNAPVIYSRLTYNVGSKYEEYGQTGISHIVEHMMFKGTKRFPKGTISELISANGGVFNAFTSDDITVYYELLPKNKIGLAFDIESERMHKCKFDPKEFGSEINVIMEERKQRTDNSAQGLRREELNTLLYKAHPYRNPVIGWMEDLEQIDRDQAYAYYQKYYTPNNATLVLVGDFNTDEILKTVNKYFGKIPRGPELKDKKFYRVAQNGKKILEFSHSDITSPSLQMYFAAPERFTADGAALSVTGSILASKSSTSRLNKRLVRDEKLCQSVGGGLRFSKDPTNFSISASLLDDVEMAAVEKCIWEEIDSIADYPVSDYDLQKIKNKLVFADLTEGQYASSIGGTLGTYDNYIGWRYINKWSEMILAVGKDDIMRVVKQYLRPENLVVCYSRPAERDSAQTLTPAAEAEATESELGESAELDTLDVEELMAVKAQRSWLKKLFVKEDVRELYKPSLKDILPPNPIAPQIDSLVLKNNVPVYLIESHDFPTIYLMGFFKTGRLPENWERPGLRQMTNNMLHRGTLKHEFNDIVEEKSFTPYQFGVSQSWDRVSFQGYCLKQDIDKMLNCAYETLAEPSFADDQLEKIRPIMVTKARNFKKTDTMKAFYDMFNTVFAGHQYSVSHSGEVEVLQNLTRDDLVAFYEKYYSPDKMKLIVVGDFDKEWLKTKLDATLGSWQHPSGSEYLDFSAIPPVEGKTVIVYSNPEYKQCRIDIGFNTQPGGICENDPDLIPLELLENILCGSSLTSRMGVKLRDQQGLSYGIKSNLWIRAHGGYWNIRTNTDKANAVKMIRGMFKEIELIQNELVTDEELNKAKARKIGLLPLYVRSADDVGSQVFEMLAADQPLDTFDQRKAQIMAVTREDLQRVARKLLDTQNYVIAISGDLAPDALDEFK